MAFSDVLPTRKDLQNKLEAEKNELREEFARRFARWVMGEGLFDAPKDSKVVDSSSRTSNSRKRATDVVVNNAGDQLELPIEGTKRVSKTSRRTKVSKK
jgi:hypothetical protein